MSGNEIEVPKELRQFMLEKAEETSLGQKNGANKQYRYGNLHIREYDDKFLIHTDKVDPREDPLGHLIHDAPEFLVGLACATIGGTKINSSLKQKKIYASINYRFSSFRLCRISNYKKDKRFRGELTS